MHIAILTFDGFNELDSLIAYGVLNRIKQPDWQVSIASPSLQVSSMNGLTLTSHIPLHAASQADAVIIGSGVQTRQVVANAELMAQLQLDPSRQLLAAQCSGTLILAKLGLLQAIPACTDLTSKPWVQEAGIHILNQPFFAKGNIATAGGCLASAYLAAWVISKLAGAAAAESALHYLAPVGEKDSYVAHAMQCITPYLAEE
ncbi:DJ-1/PfpI family protein [Vogesella mureinivorans]|uniref:DJ-1/PfpI family protein n=1 Tax=Vogesella mureinivorans TaxID=657276 RepID=UPI0011CB24B6|nr:DJ-1/PfpI family protein [Vogesella mureinivorans]